MVSGLDWRGEDGCGEARFGMVNLYTFLVGIGQVRQGSARSGLARFGGARLALFWWGEAVPGTVRHGLVRRGSLRLCLAWLLICGGLQAADIALTVDPPLSPVTGYRIYIGTSPHSYFTFYSFPETNRFLISVTNNKVYLACSALNSAGESDLSNEIVVTIGQVQLGPTIAGPWTDYMPVPVQLEQPARFVRVKLEIE